jgi:diguanylate cyclase (GGDEF)-like protein/PAS domain S-box-containing protein
MQNLKDKAAWNDAIINFSEDAIISKDLDNNIVSWNKGAEKLYGYTEAEVIGKPIAIIIPPDKYDDIQDTADIIESKKDVHHLETVRIAKDGTRIDVSVSVSPMMDTNGLLIGSSAIAHNITQRKLDEEKLRHSEERYRKIVELSPNAILIHQKNVIAFVNESAVAILGGKTKADLIGTSIWSLFTPDRHGIIRAQHQSMISTGQAAITIEHTATKLNGETISVEVSSCPISFEDQPAVYIIMRDITDRKNTRMYLEMQYAVSKTLIEASNLMDGAATMLKIICSALKIEVGKLWTINKQENNMHCISTWANDENTDRLIDKIKSQKPLASGEGLPGKIWITQETYWTDLTEDEAFKLGIAIPIFNNQEMIGVLELLNSQQISKDKRLIETLESLSNQIGFFIVHKLAESEIIYLNKHDIITGLSNRQFFEETLTFEIYRAKSKGNRIAILLLDVDNFSTINESLGSEIGDEALKILSKLLLTLSPNNENVCRYGGDQFALILDQPTKVEEITDFFNQLNNASADSFNVKGEKLNIQFNVGVSLYPEDGNDKETLLKNASIALTKAKKFGRGSLQFCTNDMTSRAKKRIRTENELREALDKNEFLLYYQPVVEIPSLIITGFEALIRWSKNGQIIPPTEFISIIEDTHLIVPIGEWALTTACTQANEWQKTMGRPIAMSVNISSVQFTHSNILASIQGILTATQLEPHCLKVEITESEIMNDVQRSVKILNSIKALGVKISIDDFGTGYSSLSYLRQLPIDYLKIDRSFVINMVDNPNDAAIVRTIVALANNLGYKIIVEGIETEEQLNFINQLGNFEIQGYYFGRPMPKDEATEFLKQNKMLL